MPEIDLGLVKGEKGDPFKYSDFTADQLAALKGDPGVTPTIKAGTATSLDATASPTVTATTSGTTTTFNFGIPKGDTSALETPTFDDTTSTYSTLTAANTAAETSSNAIKSKTSIFTTLSNMKKSFSAIVQGLKILGTNVGAITGITSDLAGESETVAASIKCVNQLNSSLSVVDTKLDIITEYDSNTTKDIVNIRLPKGIYLVLACSHPSETIYDGFECTPSSNNNFFVTQSFVKAGQIGTGYMIASWNCIVENYSDTEDAICNIRLWCSKACKISTNYKVIRLKTNT